MTELSKTKSHLKPVRLKIYANFESNSESVKSYEWFHPKKYQSDNLAKRLHTNNQQKCIDCLKPRSNKNERECKKCDSNYFYVPNYESYSFVVLLKSIILSLKQKTKSHLLVDSFKELSIFDKPIDKPKIKRLKNIYLLSEFSFFEELSIIKTNHAFRGYAMSCKVEIIERENPIDQLETRKSSIKDVFSDLVNEAKYKSIEI